MNVTLPERPPVRRSGPFPLPERHIGVARQFAKFVLVGVSNTLLTLAVYTILLKGFDVWYLAASAIGFIVGATNGFIWNRRWTFSGHVGDAYTPVRWGVVQTFGLAVNELLLFALVRGAGLGELIAQVLATAVVTVTTFILNRAWTFRIHPVAVEGEG